MHRNRNAARELVFRLLDLAGITVNGSALWDIQIHNDQFYARVLRDADLGLGESYIEGWWDCQRIDLLIERIVKANIESKLKRNPQLAFKLLLSKVFNFQTKRRALQVGRHHYDLGNDLFKAMLDRNMNYTCAYWKNADTLDEAQVAKLELTCKKLLLSPGLRLLDIGCGWGALAKHAAENYGVYVVGITISKQQYEFAKEQCKKLPIEIRFQDYRDVTEKFDRICSLGMFEHVGYLNYREYMQIINRCLNDDGLFLLHTIGGNESTTHAMPWITKYIFPNSMIPSIAQIGTATEKLLIMEDWQNLGMDYYKTLMVWHHNFNSQWNQLKTTYDDKFFRMWNYYLLSSAAGFNTRMLQLWQIVFSKGLKFRYDAAR
ncbi:cyclopropane fatty acid synthase [Legionella lansingensis]|uniref:Cyclopropane fatty acid synthase n=1 Tax=Legionella lansingensis TaxID=45067 RepID=A0A0W0VGG8_9GAMM|nr:cyclopropane fatty acyl phospholipid synthase [Legionella lansingensis]KTD19260.1 cyclopropane fatty acid synthase [Legionella lansingensis]SNV50580.1 cyclopropane fatty acid synthase [Legionella lansingensis]